MKSVLAALFIFPSAAFSQQLSEAETGALLAEISASRSGHAIQADFIEKKTLPMWKEPVVESGKIAFEPPDKFLRETKNLTLSDGKTLWMYYPEFQQVEKYPLSGNGGPAQLFSALGQVLQFHRVAEIFKVSAVRLEGGYRLILIPRSGPLRRMLQSMTIELDSSLKLRSSLMIGKEGDRIETTYSGEKILPAGAINFSFTPPASATVVAPLGGG